MDMSLAMLFIIAAVIIAGFITNINPGLLAMIVSYFVGCFIMGITPAKIQGFWPLRIFFILFSVSLFYNFATNNGTMSKLANHILYKYGRSAKVFPFVIMAVGAVLSAAGAGAYSIVALLCPLSFLICDGIGMNRLVGAMAVYYGAVGAAPFPAASNGAMEIGIMQSIGMVNEAYTYGLINFGVNMAYFALSMVVFYFLFKGHKAVGAVNIEKPEPYTREQKTSLILIGVFVLVLLLPFTLGVIFPKNAFIASLKKYNDIAFTALILSVLSIILKVGDEKKAVSGIPWGTIVMVCGISIIVQVAVSAGTIKMVTKAIGGIENTTLIPTVMTLGAGIMSIFSSTTGVVLPTLWPTVPEISAATGIAAPILLSSILCGSVSTGMSPFSACGGIMMSCCDEGYAKKLYRALFPIFVAQLIFGVMLAAIVTTLILR